MSNSLGTVPCVCCWSRVWWCRPFLSYHNPGRTANRNKTDKCSSKLTRIAPRPWASIPSSLGCTHPWKCLYKRRVWLWNLKWNCYTWMFSRFGVNDFYRWTHWLGFFPDWTAFPGISAETPRIRILWLVPYRLPSRLLCTPDWRPVSTLTSVYLWKNVTQ